jgi:hypothetical protein
MRLWEQIISFHPFSFDIVVQIKIVAVMGCKTKCQADQVNLWDMDL